MMKKSKDIIISILEKYRNLDINELHEKAFEELKELKELYYQKKTDEFLEKIEIPNSIKTKLRKEILKPVFVNGKHYSNFMEETVRRISQSIQPISGNIAEICAMIELQKYNLIENVHFKRKINRTDLIIYYPLVEKNLKYHRVEIKNVSFRERATRGLYFDGDSLLGFFNNPKEFTKETIRIIDDLCKEKSGYCYIPPSTLNQIKYSFDRLKENTKFGKEMAYFVKNGFIP
ncbi:MAG: hypothetical protein ABIN05_04090 [candidate division WOR-3 bacterium]